MARYREKPIEVEAVRYEGGPPPEGFFGWNEVTYEDGADVLTINTLEGTIQANIGDWAVRDSMGMLSVCEHAMFEAKYER